MREMRVAVVGVSAPRAQPLLLLQERQGPHRVVSIWIGEAEATVIELERSHLASPRPATHTLIAQVITACGHRLLSVYLTELTQDIYHAELVCDPNIRISARPSDAIALALHTGVPILAEDTLVEQAGLDPRHVIDLGPAGAPPQIEHTDDPAEDALERFRHFLDHATPEDFNTEY